MPTMPVSFRGGMTCTCVVRSLPWVEADMLRRGLIQSNIDIYQLGYRTDVSASKGTHSRGGCVDVGQYLKDQIQVWREWGWTMQRRDLTGIKTHAHGWPYGCPHLSETAQRQEDDWNRQDAGLVGTALVKGMWPVDHWEIAFRKRVMSLLSELVEDIANELATNKRFLNAVADAVLERDGKVDNVFGLPAGNFVAPKTALRETGADVRAIRKLVEAKLS